MSEKFFINPATGEFLGVYVDGAEPPAGAFEVMIAPPDGTAVWKGDGWIYDAVAKERATMVCSRFQLRAALHIMELLTKFEEAVAQSDMIVQIAWSDAATFNRDSSTVAAVAKIMGMTDTTIDDLFRKAMTIVS